MSNKAALDAAKLGIEAFAPIGGLATPELAKQSKDTKSLTDDEFVRAWIKAFKEVTGLRELANTLGMEYTSVSLRAASLRKAGVRLPTMPKKNQNLNALVVDVEGLNKLITAELGERALDWRNR